MLEGNEARRPYIFEREWLRFEAYVIDSEGRIGPAPGSRLYSYCPFDFYYSPVPEEVASDILSGRRVGGLAERPPYLHTLFASLEPGDAGAFLRFTNHFGLLWLEQEAYEEALSSYVELLVWDGMAPEEAAKVAREDFLRKPVTRRDQVRDTLPLALRKPVPLREMLDEQWLFRWALELCVAYAAGGRSLGDVVAAGARRIAEAPIGFSEQLRMVARAVLEGEEDPLGSAEDFLEVIMDESLAEVRPALTVGTWEEVRRLRGRGLLGETPLSFGFTWVFRSLLSAMYLMLLLDITQGKLLRQCANALCGRFFIAARPDNRYCSPECQNRAKQRRHKWERKLQRGAIRGPIAEAPPQ